MGVFEQKKELWKRAYYVLRDFKGICHEIEGKRRKKVVRQRATLTTRLRCGCEPHGHKCLVIEGGCGRCVKHCVCRYLEIIRDLASAEPCKFDHHGSCQAHGWMARHPQCPHARAKEALEAK